MSNVTMKDIAKRAGVSQPLVSVILNNYTKIKVSDASREKVQRIAREMNYTPNQAARSLKTGKTKIIGITGSPGVPVTEVFRSPYFAELYTGLGHVFTEGGYRMLFQQHTTATAADDPLNLARANMVDGLVFILLADFMESFERTQLPLLQSLGVPFTVVHSINNLPGCVSVGIDQRQGAYLAVKHLLDHGYRDVGFVHPAGPGILNEQSRAGYEQALSEAGIPPVAERIYGSDAIYSRGGIGLAERMLAAGTPLPRALFFVNSALAQGFLFAVRRAGMRVPEDVAITACGDIPYASEDINELTMYRHPAREKGAEAAQQLLAMIDDPAGTPENKTNVLDMPFVKGCTCGC